MLWRWMARKECFRAVLVKKEPGRRRRFRWLLSVEINNYNRI